MSGKRLFSCILVVSVMTSGIAVAQSGGTFQIQKSVISSGGGQATGGVFTLDGTVGQSLAGVTSTGGSFELSSGFWGGGQAAVVSNVTVSGRVFTSDGRGLRNAVVSITDPSGARRSVLTTLLGFYSFEDVPSGQEYLISVNSKRFRFQSRRVQISDSIANLDFTGLE